MVIDGDDTEHVLRPNVDVYPAVQLMDWEKREPECSRVEIIDFILLWNVNESTVAYFNFVVISKLNDLLAYEVS
jgi:hypothetical protein